MLGAGLGAGAAVTGTRSRGGGSVDDNQYKAWRARAGGGVTLCGSLGQDAWGQRKCPGEDHLAEQVAFHVVPRR